MQKWAFIIKFVPINIYRSTTKDAKAKIGTLEAEITVDVNYAKTLQTVIDGCEAREDLRIIFQAILNFDKPLGSIERNSENMNENFGLILERDDMYTKEILLFINSLIQENKKLKSSK